MILTPTTLQVKQAVLDSLLDLLPEQTSKKRMSSCTLKEAYVSKMVKVNDSDRWSLIALGNNKTNSVELKFVDRMKRKFEFSVDSFHIMLDTLFLFYDCARMDIRSEKPPELLLFIVFLLQRELLSNGGWGERLWQLWASPLPSAQVQILTKNYIWITLLVAI